MRTIVPEGLLLPARAPGAAGTPPHGDIQEAPALERVDTPRMDSHARRGSAAEMRWPSFDLGTPGSSDASGRGTPHEPPGGVAEELVYEAVAPDGTRVTLRLPLRPLGAALAPLAHGYVSRTDVHVAGWPPQAPPTVSQTPTPHADSGGGVLASEAPIDPRAVGPARAPIQAAADAGAEATLGAGPGLECGGSVQEAPLRSESAWQARDAGARPHGPGMDARREGGGERAGRGVAEDGSVGWGSVLAGVEGRSFDSVTDRQRARSAASGGGGSGGAAGELETLVMKIQRCREQMRALLGRT